MAYSGAQDARALELELEQEAAKQRNTVSSPKQLSNADTPRQATTNRLPLRQKAAAASTNRVVKLVKDQIRANYNTIQVHFNRNDSDNTGRINQRDLLNVMERCNVAMTEQQAGEIFKILDSDDEGRSDLPPVSAKLSPFACSIGRVAVSLGIPTTFYPTRVSP